MNAEESPKPVFTLKSHPSLVYGMTEAMAADLDPSLPFDDRIVWGAMGVKLSNLDPHFLFMGATGSGKTTLLKLLMMSILISSGSAYPLKHRALVYDPKPEFYTSVRAMGVPDERIMLTNPFDARAVAWDVAADVRTSAHADELAEALVPLHSEKEGGSTDRFWDAAAHQTCRGIIRGLQTQAPGRWDLRDLAVACTSSRVRDGLLANTEFGRTVKAKFFGTKHRHSPGVDAHLMTRVGWLLTIGDLWRYAQFRFSFAGWSRSAAVLMVSRFPDAPMAADRINHLLMRWAFTTILGLPEGGDMLHDITWLIIDELTQAGRFPGFAEYMRMSRGKGARNVLSFQESGGMRTAFPKDEVSSIINQCGNKAVLAMNSYEECEHASKLFAFHETQRKSTTYGRGNDVSYTTQPETQPVVSPDSIQDLKSVRQLQGGVEGYFHTQIAGTFKQELASSQRAELLRDVDSACPYTVPGYTPRPSSQLEPLGMSKHDDERLGIDSSADASAEESAAETPEMIAETEPDEAVDASLWVRRQSSIDPLSFD